MRRVINGIGYPLGDYPVPVIKDTRRVFKVPFLQIEAPLQLAFVSQLD